jgi:Zn finger protein HypA/HybF involved in hydrogenase expression
MKKCLNCGRELINAYDTKKFCNNKCQMQLKRKQTIEKWLNTPEEIKVLSDSIKSYIKEQSGYKCSKCGWNEVNEYTGNIPIEIDHIDGNSENNHPDNLRVLCPNCHSLTSTFKGANKNSKRIYRREYYKKSKDLKRINKENVLIDKINIILTSDIDFSKKGWCNNVADKLEITPQKVRGWMRRHLPEIEENSYRRK